LSAFRDKGEGKPGHPGPERQERTEGLKRRVEEAEAEKWAGAGKAAETAGIVCKGKKLTDNGLKRQIS
jgi:hypothetical protein